MKILWDKSALKGLEKIKNNKVLKRKLYELLVIIEENPFKVPPRYEKLVGDLDGVYSRRINIKHRLVYSVDDKNSAIIIHSVWTHYEN
jgi:Txe/YoeB family toxin of toxin-antitoxin system